MVAMKQFSGAAPTSTDPNYITPDGLARLKAEYKTLFHEERPRVVEVVSWAAGNGDRSENADYIYGKRRLREIDARLGFLSSRLDKAQVVDPKTLSGDRVVFGSTVTIENDEGQVFTWQIVGVDEAKVESGKVSWKSPIAKALLGKKVGDEAIVHKPQGQEAFDVIKIEFI